MVVNSFLSAASALLIWDLFGWWGKWGKFTPKVPNMWGKCGGANVLPP
jgi:hypothetical protein